MSDDREKLIDAAYARANAERRLVGWPLGMRAEAMEFAADFHLAQLASLYDNPEVLFDGMQLGDVRRLIAEYRIRKEQERVPLWWYDFNGDPHPANEAAKTAYPPPNNKQVPEKGEK